MSILTKLTAVHDVITEMMFWVACVLGAAIEVIFLANIIMRYLAKSPIVWAHSVIIYSLTAMVLAGMPYLARRGTHVTIDILDEITPRKFHRALSVLQAAVASIICVCVTYVAYVIMRDQFGTGAKTTFELEIPYYTLTGMMVYGFGSSLLYYIRRMWSQQEYAEVEPQFVE